LIASAVTKQSSDNWVRNGSPTRLDTSAGFRAKTNEIAVGSATKKELIRAR
jgi:hypothetical protein